MSADETTLDNSEQSLDSPAETPVPAPAPAAGKRDQTDYDHRHFVNLLTIAFLLVVAAAIVWTIQAIEENERVQRCFASGRHDCMKIDAPQSAVTVRAPVR